MVIVKKGSRLNSSSSSGLTFFIQSHRALFNFTLSFSVIYSWGTGTEGQLGHQKFKVLILFILQHFQSIVLNLYCIYIRLKAI